MTHSKTHISKKNKIRLNFVRSNVNPMDTNPTRISDTHKTRNRQATSKKWDTTNYH